MNPTTIHTGLSATELKARGYCERIWNIQPIG